MSEKFEKLLDLLVNEEKGKAEDLFHEIVVDKSREIYEELVSNDAETEKIKEKKECLLLERVLKILYLLP